MSLKENIEFRNLPLFDLTLIFRREIQKWMSSLHVTSRRTYKLESHDTHPFSRNEIIGPGIDLDLNMAYLYIVPASTPGKHFGHAWLRSCYWFSVSDKAKSDNFDIWADIDLTCDL